MAIVSFFAKNSPVAFIVTCAIVTIVTIVTLAVKVLVTSCPAWLYVLDAGVI